MRKLLICTPQEHSQHSAKCLLFFFLCVFFCVFFFCVVVYCVFFTVGGGGGVAITRKIFKISS